MCLAAVQSTVEAGQSHRITVVMYECELQDPVMAIFGFYTCITSLAIVTVSCIWFRHDFIPENVSVDNNRVVLGASGK